MKYLEVFTAIIEVLKKNSSIILAWLVHFYKSKSDKATDIIEHNEAVEVKKKKLNAITKKYQDKINKLKRNFMLCLALCVVSSCATFTKTEVVIPDLPELYYCGYEPMQEGAKSDMDCLFHSECSLYLEAQIKEYNTWRTEILNSK